LIEYTLPQLQEAAIGSLPVWDTHRFRLTTCRRLSRCRSSICPTCSFARAFRRRDALHAIAAKLSPKRLRLITFNGGDQPLESLRECSQQMMKAARDTLKHFRVPGYAVKSENSFLGWDADAHHPHLHILVDTPTGGRGFVPSHAWGNEFFERLPNYLHPSTDHVHVSGVLESVRASATYVCKSPYHGADVSDVPRIIDSIQATMGLRHYLTHGSLKLAA
jgi:hypothetical protein